MSEKKDFLGSIASGIEKKPDSFKEEKVEVYKKPKPKPTLIAAIVLVVIALIAGVYFMFFAPKITMPDLVGQTTADLGVWAKQEGIAGTNFILIEEYSFDVKEDVIMEQSVAVGTKINEDKIITFTVSMGADPSEPILIPDLKSMNYDDVKYWIDENKLSKAKVNQIYSDTVEAGMVISYDVVGEETDFKRGTSITIETSRGPQPAKEIKVADFKDQTYAMIEDWAETNKIELEKIEQYHDTIASGVFISASVKAEDTIEQGDTLKVYISKGKAVTMIDLSKLSNEKAKDWLTDNGVKYYSREIYNEAAKGTVLSQSIKAGDIITSTSTLDIVFSKGKISISDFEGTTLEQLKAWINDINRGDNGDAQMGSPTVYWETNDAPYGTILSFKKDVYEVGELVQVVVSQGKKVNILQADLDTVIAGDETAARAFCKAYELSCEFTYVKDDTSGKEVGSVISVITQDNTALSTGYYDQYKKVTISIVETVKE